MGSVHPNKGSIINAHPWKRKYSACDVQHSPPLLPPCRWITMADPTRGRSGAAHPTAPRAPLPNKTCTDNRRINKQAEYLLCRHALPSCCRHYLNRKIKKKQFAEAGDFAPAPACTALGVIHRSAPLQHTPIIDAGAAFKGREAG